MYINDLTLHRSEPLRSQVFETPSLEEVDVTVYEYGVKVKKKSRNGSTGGKGIFPRKKNLSNGVSKKTLSELRFFVMNMGAKTSVVLTFPKDQIPLDGQELKRIWQGMGRKLVKNKFSGVMIYELAPGWPHIHLVLQQQASVEEIERLWNQVLGLKHEKRISVYIQECSKVIDTALYLAKSRTKYVPEKYEGIGRIWGKFGKPKLMVYAHEKGSAFKMAPLLRQLKKAARWGLVKKRRDNGIRGYRLQVKAETALRALKCFSPDLSYWTPEGEQAERFWGSYERWSIRPFKSRILKLVKAHFEADIHPEQFVTAYCSLTNLAGRSQPLTGNSYKSKRNHSKRRDRKGLEAIEMYTSSEVNNSVMEFAPSPHCLINQKKTTVL